MQEWVRKHGFGDDKALLDYAYHYHYIMDRQLVHWPVKCMRKQQRHKAL